MLSIPAETTSPVSEFESPKLKAAGMLKDTDSAIEINAKMLSSGKRMLLMAMITKLAKVMFVGVSMFKQLLYLFIIEILMNQQLCLGLGTSSRI